MRSRLLQSYQFTKNHFEQYKITITGTNKADGLARQTGMQGQAGPGKQVGSGR
jgi:hypothetical protein